MSQDFRRYKAQETERYAQNLVNFCHNVAENSLYEPRHEKTCFLHMQKQRHRPTVWFPRSCIISRNFYLLVISGCTALLVSNLVRKSNDRFLRRGSYEQISLCHMSLVVRKPVFGVSVQVPHKPGCTATKDGYKLEISDLGSRRIVLSM